MGKDGNGKYLKETVAGYNVNTAYIAEKDVPTGLGVVTTRRDGAVKITVLKGANFALEKADLEPLREILPDVSWMILQMEIPTEIDEALLDMAAEYGCKVVLNAAPPAPFSDEAFRKADITVFNETEALYYLGYRLETREEAYKALRDLRDRFRNDVVITLGKDGAVCLEKDAAEPAFIPALPMKAVDTTGAGDSFIGGMVYAVSRVAADHKTQIIRADTFQCVVCETAVEPVAVVISFIGSGNIGASSSLLVSASVVIVLDDAERVE